MKVVIAGSRKRESLTDLLTVFKAIEDSGFQITEVVSGMCPYGGVDFLGELYAEWKRLGIAQFPADWVRLGKAAGPIRNQQMLDYADAVIVVWDGKSRGSSHMLSIAKASGKPVFEARFAD